MITKRLGQVELCLSLDVVTGVGMLHTEHWMSGDMPYADAIAYFDSITGASQLADIIGDAYGRASGGEY